MAKAILPLFFLFIISTGCGTNYGLPKDDQRDISAMLCNCMESTLPGDSPSVIKVFEFALENNEEEAVKSYISELASGLEDEEREVFLREMEYYYDADIDDVFAYCGEPILEKYPSLDEMNDDLLVEMILENFSDDCKLSSALVKLYQAEN